jgi:hypothetical protein
MEEGHMLFGGGPETVLFEYSRSFAERMASTLVQIKFLLGRSSSQTTERYLGSEQDIVIAVSDNLGI